MILRYHSKVELSDLKVDNMNIYFRLLYIHGLVKNSIGFRRFNQLNNKVNYFIMRFDESIE